MRCTRRRLSRQIETAFATNRSSIVFELLERLAIPLKKMMATIGRVNRILSVPCYKFSFASRFHWWSDRVAEWKRSRHEKSMLKPWLGILAGMLGSCGIALYFLNESSVKAFEAMEIAIPRYPWMFKGMFKTFDHAALRRGWQVYQVVCRTCHSLRYVRFIDLINETHSIEEVQQIATEFQVEDGPDEQGNYYTRPAKLSDFIPPPFPNEQAARAANFGAYPSDLTYLAINQKHGIDYLFSMLTGWMEPPAGMNTEQGQYFNVYFIGGFTAMPQLLFDDMINYDDGTRATVSQMAKDVAEFLMWTATPDHDARKIMTIKCIGIFTILAITAINLFRRNWSLVTSRRLAYVPNTVTVEPQLPKSFFDEQTTRGSKKSGALLNR